MKHFANDLVESVALARQPSHSHMMLVGIQLFSMNCLDVDTFTRSNLDLFYP